MSKTNCINCGAAKDTDEIKCPFCGTTYLDLTAIDFSTGDPVVCQFVLPKQFRYGRPEGKDRVIMSMLALPRLDEISMTNDSYLEVTSLHDSFRRYVPTAPNINVGISFHPVMRKDGTMFDIRQEEGGQ